MVAGGRKRVRVHKRSIRDRVANQEEKLSPRQLQSSTKRGQDMQRKERDRSPALVDLPKPVMVGGFRSFQSYCMCGTVKARGRHASRRAKPARPMLDKVCARRPQFATCVAQASLCKGFPGTACAPHLGWAMRASIRA